MICADYFLNECIYIFFFSTENTELPWNSVGLVEEISGPG